MEGKGRGKEKIKGEAEVKGPLKEKGKGNLISETLTPDSLHLTMAHLLPQMASVTIGHEETVTASMVPIATLSTRDHKEEASAKILSPPF